MGQSALNSVCRHGSKRNSPNRYILLMGGGPLTGDMCEPISSRFSSAAFRNICNPHPAFFHGLRGLSVFFIVFSEFLKDFPTAFIENAPTRREIRRLIVKRRLSARTAHERMSRLSNPAGNFRVRGAFAASRLSVSKGQVSPRVHIMAKQL